MDGDISLHSIGSLLCQFALQIQELSQKKNECNQQIEVCRADIADWRSRIETLNGNIKKLEEEIRLKQSSVSHNKTIAKSIKVTNSQLLQYEQTLKAELESRKSSYNEDTKVFGERIASYEKIFQSHRDYYCQNPLAQKLLRLQAENEEIEGRIKACDEQITVKQKEFDQLSAPVVTTSSTDKLPHSVCGQQSVVEPQEQSNDEAGDNISDSESPQHNRTQIGRQVSEKASTHDDEEHQDTSSSSVEQQEGGSESRTHEQAAAQSSPEEMHTDELEKERELQGKISTPKLRLTDPTLSTTTIEQQSTVSEVEGAVEAGIEDEALGEKDSEIPAVFPHSSVTASSTPTFSFNFSPTNSPYGETCNTKSPAPLFAVNSDPNTPCFSGFGFDMGSSQEEEQDTSFAFTGALFNKKKTTETKSPGGPEFLFGQSEQGEDFHFNFNYKSPQQTDDKTKEDFPFSFKF